MVKWLRIAVCLAFGACDAPLSEETAEPAVSAKPPPAVVRTVALEPASGTQTTHGVANVLNPDPLVQLDADLRAAAIAAEYSKGQAERFRSTTALSRQAVENAERQAALDASQVSLLEARLRQTWGEDAPLIRLEERQRILATLTSGAEALVRLDFPHASAEGMRNVRVSPLAGGLATPVTKFWVAPSGNLSMPGSSYFALVPAGPGLRPGDRARLAADIGPERTGVIIPSSAIVVFASQSWCYVETGPQEFKREPVSLEFPLAEGYLVAEGFAPGTKVVVRGASTLLSREAAPNFVGDDDDDGGPSAPVARAESPPSATKAARAHTASPAADTD
jgi:hypothetical protein